MLFFVQKQSYLNTYMRTYPGHYFTGDGANRDQVRTNALFNDVY